MRHRTRVTREEDAAWRKRYVALQIPITAEQITEQIPHLEYIQYGPGYCWFHGSKSSGGASSRYGRFKFNGVWVMAHRFALALKLGCTLWDLEGYDAAHAPIDICMGGRCVNPDHLSKQLANPNRWQQAKDRAKVGEKPSRTKAQLYRMLKLMHPHIPTGQANLPDFMTVV